MIDRDHELPLTHQAQQLEISRGSIYYLPRPVSSADLAIMRRIDELHLLYPFAGSRMLRDLLPADLDGIEAAFLALPHGASWEMGARLADAGVAVFDLGSDYRMDTADRYAAAYGTPHPRPGALGEWVYGLPELIGVDSLASATRVAVPGCYPTASLLGLAPLYAAGVVDGTAVVDAV